MVFFSVGVRAHPANTLNTDEPAKVAACSSPEYREADGKKRLMQGTWNRVRGGFGEIAATSTGGGKTWTPWFGIICHAQARVW